MHFLGVDVEMGGGGGVKMKKKKTVPIVNFHLKWPLLAI